VSAHSEWSYYERWSAAIANLLREKGILAPGELEMAVWGDTYDHEHADRSQMPGEGREHSLFALKAPKFGTGDEVVVRREDPSRTAWRAPHLRTPGYIFGVRGVVERYCGLFADPSLLAFGIGDGPPDHLYRVRFSQADVWPEAKAPSGHTIDESSDLNFPSDTIDVEIYESWLVPSSDPAAAKDADEVSRTSLVGLHRPGESTANHLHSHHSTADSHDHSHLPREELECLAVISEGVPRPGAAVHHALLQLLISKGFIDRARLVSTVEAIELSGRKMLGARLVARAWMDEAFKERLLNDANAAASELGIAASNPNAPTKLTVIANDASFHNLVVCTLCSCYPAALLGPSPAWYKSRSYRARAVRTPRALLSEAFGLELPRNIALRVHDSTADLRYMVLPERPPNTDGWDEARLAELVSRDELIGVARK